jgi:hypothetical protein
MNVWRLFIISLLSFFILPSFAQKKQFQGRVITTDSLSLQAIVSLKKTDSSTVNKMVTDSSGRFFYTHIVDGNYILQVEAVGYNTSCIPFEVRTGKYTLPKVIQLSVSTNDLGSVVVSSKKPAVIIKEDTIEYRSSAIKLGADATTEDIFQKIPGLEVSKNGSIKANGEPVTQIYVDGKPFFGTDIRAVTQNFPADMIDKIQVINKKPEGAIDDGSYEKIINITLKKNKKLGIFSNNAIGNGTSNRYDMKTSTNYLHYDTKLSIMGTASNINGSDANSPGDLRNNSFKISFATSSRKFDISTWAAFVENNNNVAQQLYRQNIYADSSNNYLEQSDNHNKNKNFNTGLYLEYKPDSFSVIKLNESAGYAASNLANNAIFKTIEQKTAGFININNGTSSANVNNASAWLNGTINYERRLGFNGRNISVDFSNRLNTNSGTYYNTYNNYFTDSSFDFIQNRYTDQKNNNSGVTASTSYFEPLTANSSLGVSYSWNYNNNDLPKEIYNYDPLTGLHDSMLTSYSNHFDNTSNCGTATLTYNYRTKKIGFSAWVKYKNANLNSNAFDKDSNYHSNFKGLLPNISFYTLTKKFSQNIDYNMYIKAPDALQLQPVIDATNPLFIQLGNPDLKYTVVQMLRYKCNWYNSKKETGINARASFSMLSNNISSNINYNQSTGQQVITSVNTSGAYNWNAWCTFYKPFHIGYDKIKWNINVSGGGYSNMNLFNGESNVTTYSMMKILTGFLYDTKSWIDLRTNFSFMRQENQYSMQGDLNTAIDYITINPVVTIRPTESTEINIDYDHRMLNSNDGTLSNNINLLNANVKQYVDDKKAIAVSLKAFDLLNENNNTVRSFGDNFIQDINFNSLSRYLLLSVSFRLEHFN